MTNSTPANIVKGPSTNGPTYLLADSGKGRKFPSHGFTTPTLLRKRYAENTSTAAITLNLILPYLNAFNARLEGHIKDGRDLTTEDALKHLGECALVAGINYADVLSRVAIQTGLATLLIENPTAAGDATVYLWDAYPRLHRKYLGDVIAALHLPKFVASMFGVMPSDADLQIFGTRAPFMNIFEDSIRRHALTTVSDVIVTNARSVITNVYAKKKLYKAIKVQEQVDVEGGLLTAEEAKTISAAKRREAAAQHAVCAQVVALTTQKIITLVGRAAGAAIGNLSAGGRGEYWGEMTFGLVSAAVGASLLSKMVKKSNSDISLTPTSDQ